MSSSILHEHNVSVWYGMVVCMASLKISNLPLFSVICERLRFLSPSTADTDWLRGILDLLVGENVSWLKRFLRTFVTSVQHKTAHH